MSLPGRPDLVFARFRCVILVNGCFWHGHSCANGSRRPKTNKIFWAEKIRVNQLRDQKNVRSLRRMGWRVLVIWECQLKPQDKLSARMVKFLGPK
jgi:DNA mismatch endonuclease, patch repair protein